MKKLLIMSIALVAIMATVFTVSAFAANTVEITGVSLAKYGSADTFNDAYANVTVNYTVPEGTVDRLTFYLAAQGLSSALEGEEAKVIYIDEQVEADAGSLTFVIEKARVLTALNAAAAEGTTYTNATVEGLVLTFKLGGTEVETADEYEVVYVNPTKYGDLNGDGEYTTKDTLAIKRFGVGTKELTLEEQLRADTNGDGELTTKDTLAIMRMGVGSKSYQEILEGRTWAY